MVNYVPIWKVARSEQSRELYQGVWAIASVGKLLKDETGTCTRNARVSIADLLETESPTVDIGDQIGHILVDY